MLILGNEQFLNKRPVHLNETMKHIYNFDKNCFLIVILVNIYQFSCISCIHSFKDMGCSILAAVDTFTFFLVADWCPFFLFLFWRFFYVLHGHVMIPPPHIYMWPYHRSLWSFSIFSYALGYVYFYIPLRDCIFLKHVATGLFTAL